MAIIFNSEVNETREGQDDIELGEGTLIAAQVALQGFYMSYGEEEDNHLKQILAWVGNPSTEVREGNNFIKYGYACYMHDDDSPKHEAGGRIRSLVIAELDDNS
jgi:hypothetical protein